MKSISKYTFIKFHKIINGILCIISSIPFIICGTYIIIHQLNDSISLLISLLGIITCIITGITSMLEYDKTISI